MSIGYVCLIDIDKTNMQNKSYKLFISYEDDINDILNINESIVFLISCFHPKNLFNLIYNEFNLYIELNNNDDDFKCQIDILSNIYNKFINNNTSLGLNLINRITKKELDYVGNIIDNLPSIYFNNNTMWEKVGNCLYNIHNYDDTLLKKWIDISKIYYTNDIIEKCHLLWNNYIYNGYNLEILVDWLKQHNKITYNSIHDQYVFNLIKDNIEQGKCKDYDIVEMFHQIYKYQYINIKKDGTYIWYEYKYRRWIRLRNIGVIRNKLSNEFKIIFENLIEYYNNEIDIVDNIHFNNISKLIRSLRKICNKLSNSDKKKKIISKCKSKFQLPNHELDLRLITINNIYIQE
jgi:hypothetical protein